MTRSFRRYAASGLALAASAALGAMTSLAQESVLVKPINQYFIGDIFPRAASEASAETGRAWRTSAEELNRDAEARIQAISVAATAKKAEVQAAKRQLSEAKREKNLVEIGRLEGTVKSEELLLDILEDLNDLSRKQMQLAESWRDAGNALERYTAADIAFDPFRTRRLTRPQDEGVDERLGIDGVQAFRTQAEAMANLGDTFRRLGERARSLAKDRLDLLKTLEKGGHLRAGT